MKSLFARFVKDESGATAIEYSLIAAAVALLIVTITPALQTALNAIFQRIITALQNAP
jgi:pilus assembly protein Flp/PilA